MRPHTEQRKVGMVGGSSIVGKKDRDRNRRSSQGEASLALVFVVSDRVGIVASITELMVRTPEEA